MGPHLETPRIAPPDWEDFSHWAPVRPAPLLRLVPMTNPQGGGREGDMGRGGEPSVAPVPHGYSAG
jgi:hypothetical protein